MKRREHAGHAARRQLRRDRSSDQRRTPGRRGTDHAPARGPDPEFSWTPTGISVSIDGLTIDADHATNSQYGQRALVSIRAGDRLCYRQRLNLEDPHQRQTFIAKLVLSCEQAGMMDVLTLVKHRVTPRLLIELGDACRRRRAKPLTDPHAEQAQRTAAEQRAGSLLDDPTILSRVGEAMRANGYAGKLEPAQLAYVALTSRLLEERPINLELLGDPAAGKNATIDAALALIPREGVYEFTASSPTALVYTEEDFQHRVVIFKEADSIPDRGPAASAVRALAEENVLRYEVMIRGPRTGGFETWRIEKAGPTGLITTSTRPTSPQLHTRLLPVPIVNSDDRLTTAAVICAKGERASGRLPPGDPVERFLALQHWLALGGERRVIVPFGWVLGRAMSTCPLELRTRRDFEALLACVRTIAFLHQRRRQRAPGGEIEAMIDDYGAARALLIGSFFAAEAESLPAAIRELVRAIGDKEEITRTHLRERVSRPRSTFYYQVDKAIELRLLNEKKRGGRCVLTRNRDVPLPEKRPPLPEVEMVEGLFFGVPAPIGDDWFDRFISDFQNFGGPDGITAAEWAAWVGQPIKVVRRRLRRLARWSSLVYFRKTKRYAFRIVETPIDAPHGPAVPANPTPASNSSPGSNSPPDQPKSSDVQPSNESGEDMSGEDASTGSVSDPPLQPPPTPLAPESQGSPDPRSVPEPSATKPPPPAGGS